MMGVSTVIEGQADKTNNGAFWRRLTLPQEDRQIPWDGKGYRWFKSENVFCIEHFRQPRKQGQKAGRFGWAPIEEKV
jgi:hypothetical protein